MAEKEQQSAYEGGTEAQDKRTKLIIYTALFTIFQTAVIAVFALTVMKVKTPKFRMPGATFSSNIDTRPGGLQATMIPHFSVENTNFGSYVYDATTVDFFHGDAKIGEGSVPSSEAGWRSTKRFVGPPVDLRFNSSPKLSMTIRSSARMTGRVELMFIMTKNRATNMNCTMDITIASSTLTNFRCN